MDEEQRKREEASEEERIKAHNEGFRAAVEGRSKGKTSDGGDERRGRETGEDSCL